MNQYLHQQINHLQNDHISINNGYANVSAVKNFVNEDGLPMLTFHDIVMVVKMFEVLQRGVKVKVGLLNSNGVMYKFSTLYCQLFRKIFVSEYSEIKFEIKDTGNKFNVEFVMFLSGTDEKFQLSQVSKEIVLECVAKFRQFLKLVGYSVRYDRLSYQICKNSVKNKRQVSQIFQRCVNYRKSQQIPSTNSQNNNNSNNIIYLQQIKQCKYKNSNPQNTPKTFKNKYISIEKKSFQITQKNSQSQTLDLVQKKVKQHQQFTQQQLTQQQLQKKIASQLQFIKSIKDNKYLLQYYNTQTNKNSFYMEYIQNTLKTLVHRSKISSKNTLKIIRQIIEAVNILHGSNIVHRDLKMDNILVKDLGGDDLRIKIIDYGECAFMGSQYDRQCTLGATLPYSPIQCILDGEQGYNKAEIDLWSILVIIYQMFYKYLPVFYSKGICTELAQGWKNDNNFYLSLPLYPKKGLRRIQQVITLLVYTGLKIQQKQRIPLKIIDQIIQSLQKFQHNVIEIFKESVT